MSTQKVTINTTPTSTTTVTTTTTNSPQPGYVTVRPIKAAEVSPNEIVIVNTPPIPKPLFRPALKPVSINTEPWTSFGSFDTRIFKDDFCHEKHFTGKVKATSIDGATINLKETATLDDKNALKISDELKLWFPINYGPQYLHLRIKDKDNRVHYDNGITELGGEKVNLYSSFGWARDFKNYNFKLGLATVWKEFNTDNRIRITSDRNVAFYHKTLISKNDVRFGFIGVLDLTKQLLLKKDILLGYRYKQWDFIAKAEQPFVDNPTNNFNNPAEWYSSVSLTSLYTHNSKQKYAATIDVNPIKSTWLATGLVEYKHNDKSFAKIAANSAGVLTLVVKKTISSLWALSGGVQLPLLEEKGSKNKNRFGVQVDFNV